MGLFSGSNLTREFLECTALRQPDHVNVVSNLYFNEIILMKALQNNFKRRHYELIRYVKCIENNLEVVHEI